MTASPAKHRAFFIAYDGIKDELTIPVSIIPINTDDATPCGEPAAVEALWDTGATLTCIKPALWERLKLRPLESGGKELAGVGGRVTAEAALVNLLLTPEFGIAGCPVYAADFPSCADVLIGMDIIRMGDFAVCNADGKTSFSFAVPPFPDRVNFEDKAEATNRHGAP